MFEDWLQDTQLGVNECFENPETRLDVEACMQRLQVSNSFNLQLELLMKKLIRSDSRIQQLYHIPEDTVTFAGFPGF